MAFRRGLLVITRRGVVVVDDVPEVEDDEEVVVEELGWVGKVGWVAEVGWVVEVDWLGEVGWVGAMLAFVEVVVDVLVDGRVDETLFESAPVVLALGFVIPVLTVLLVEEDVGFVIGTLLILEIGFVTWAEGVAWEIGDKFGVPGWVLPAVPCVFVFPPTGMPALTLLNNSGFFLYK